MIEFTCFIGSIVRAVIETEAALYIDMTRVFAETPLHKAIKRPPSPGGPASWRNSY